MRGTGDNSTGRKAAEVGNSGGAATAATAGEGGSEEGEGCGAGDGEGGSGGVVDPAHIEVSVAASRPHRTRCCSKLTLLQQ